MKTVELSRGELALLVGTRALLGAGIGLLAGGRLSSEKRNTAGVVLLAVGLLTTIPLAMDIFGSEGKQTDE